MPLPTAICCFSTASQATMSLIFSASLVAGTRLLPQLMAEAAVMAEAKKAKVDVVDCPVTIENEVDAMKALAWAKENGVNACCMFLGNFGPEGPTTLFVQKFGGPTMVLAAKEENRKGLASDRGDALCGVLNFSYNCGLRRLAVHIPERPNVTAKEGVAEIRHFLNVARVVNGLRNLKVIGFGPRPQDFYACNAPIQPMYDLGIEVEENSELDMRVQFEKVAGRKKEIAAIEADLVAGKIYTSDRLAPAQAELEQLVERWAELEERQMKCENMKV